MGCHPSHWLSYFSRWLKHVKTTNQLSCFWWRTPHGCRAWKKSKFPGCRAGPAWRKWWLRRNAVQFHEPIIGCHPPVNSLMWTWNNNPGPFFDEQAVERDVWVQILKCWYLHSFGGHGFTLPPKNGWRPYMAVLDILGQSQLIGGVPFSKFSAGRGRAPVVGRCWAPTSSLKLEVSKAGHQWTWYILLGRVFPTVIELTRKDADSSKDTQWYSMFLFCLLDPGMLGDIFCNPMCRMSSTKLGWRTLKFLVSWSRMHLADQPAKNSTWLE